jgi:hypothetical protein
MKNLLYKPLWQNNYHDSVAEWSMALVLGTSLFGGKGSNPFTVIISTFDCVLKIFYRSLPSIDVGLLAQLVRAPC